MAVPSPSRKTSVKALDNPSHAAWWRECVLIIWQPGLSCHALGYQDLLSPKSSRIAKSTVLVATLATTHAATVSTPPSIYDQRIYPDVNTLPTYNYLDTVNASWTSNFLAQYLLLRCQHPNDAVHYAYPYNQSVSPTGSTLVPLDDGNAWVCHFEVSDLGTSSATPPTFISSDFNNVLHAGQQPVLWTDSQEGEGTAASSAALDPTTGPPMSAISTSSTTTSSVTITTDQPLPSAASTPITTPASSSTPETSSAMTPTPTQPARSPTPSNTPTGLSKERKSRDNSRVHRGRPPTPRQSRSDALHPTDQEIGAGCRGLQKRARKRTRKERGAGSGGSGREMGRG